MHDLIEYIIDNQTKSRLVFRKLSYPYNCRHADRIITVSDNTKKDLIKYLNIPAEKIKIAYNGYSDIIYMENKDDASEYVFKKYGIKNYLFYIGYLTHPQKNLIYLINEFKKVLNTYPDSQLTFAGPLGKDSVLILKHAAEILGDRKFKYLGKVPAEDLRYLYSACEAFCFPSLYEGFGMPVLEAMACGAPVITSNISSMPEILNDDRFLINPYCPDDLYNKALCILSENRDKITSRNVERAKSFSWTNHGKILYETIKEISSKVILNIK
jgi:glycosyltransferase involved in cell wall biosynthesis